MTQIDPYAATNALARGYDLADSVIAGRARRQAGNALASGDVAGAVSALGGAGELESVVALQGAQQRQQRSEQELQLQAQEQARQFTLRAATGMRTAPPEMRDQVYQTLRPTLAQIYPPEVLAQIDASPKDDASLDSLILALGGEQRSAPAGYRWGAGGQTLEAIPGGPEDPRNQRPIVTPYGIMLPPGAPMPPGLGQGAAPAQPRSLGSTVPQGWSTTPPRPNQPSPARPATGGGERAQPVSVSFNSSQQARQAIAQVVPGVTFTSGRRSPADNQRVRGARGSFHLQDRAWDLVPPRGMSMSQLASKMRQQGFRVLNEGDHVHVSW